MSADTLTTVTGSTQRRNLAGQRSALQSNPEGRAGFQRHPLNEPGLPARHLVEDAGTYKFADPDFCHCVYTGGAKEYAELQRLRAERLAERDWILRHTVAGNSVDLVVWGPWKPEGLDVIAAPVAAR